MALFTSNITKPKDETTTSKPTKAKAPTNPNSPGYQEYVDRGGGDTIEEYPVDQTAQNPRNTRRYALGGNSNVTTRGDITQGTPRGDISVDNSTLPRTTRQSGTNTQTSKTTYTGTAPEAPKPFKAPDEWTPERRAGEIQSQAALGLKANRQALREAIASLGNDPASRLALRDALAAHGINIERTLLGAKTAAASEEARDINTRLSQAQAEFNAAQTTFEDEFRKYLSTGTTTTTSSQDSTSTSKLGQLLEEARKKGKLGGGGPVGVGVEIK